ncbi:MAG: phosphoribosylglycinamide formyltransferase [Candidatus Hodarchaeota archaeon]
MKKIGVLISGRGSNLQSILDAQKEPRFPGKVVVVISNKQGVQGLERAKKVDIATHVVDNKEYESRTAHEDAIAQLLFQYEVELVVLAGYMRLLSPLFLKKFPDCVINIHPSLLPAFPGMCGQRQALEYGVRISGCTTHFVDEGEDTGPIILQKAVPILQDDDESSLTERILAEEHKIMVESVRLWCEGKLRLEGRHVHILE